MPDNPLPVSQAFLGEAPGMVEDNSQVRQSGQSSNVLEDNSQVRQLFPDTQINNSPVQSSLNNNTAAGVISNSTTYPTAGINNSGAFIPGNHQIANPNNTTTWPVSFQSVQGNPFSSNQNTADGTKGLYGG